MAGTKTTRSNFFLRIGRIHRISAASLLLALLLAAGVAACSAQTPAPIGHAHIYPAVDQARPDIQHALVRARRTHRRVLLDFGGDWCPDCQVLNIYFHQSPNAELLAKHFILVDVNIGRMDANLDIAHRYGVPVTGVPALAVLNGYGKVVFAQHNQFADMRNMKSSDLTAFLNKWKP